MVGFVVFYKIIKFKHKLNFYCLLIFNFNSLGANHDGSDNDCLSGDQYIMALAPNPVANRIYNNTLSFSNCSKTDFSKYIDKLNKSVY